MRIRPFNMIRPHSARAASVSCPPYDVVDTREARDLADRLCRAAPLAARATKEVAVRTRDMGWTEAVRFGETMRRVTGATADATEGRAARREGRAPEWEGR